MHIGPLGDGIGAGLEGPGDPGIGGFGGTEIGFAGGTSVRGTAEFKMAPNVIIAMKSTSPTYAYFKPFS